MIVNELVVKGWILGSSGAIGMGNSKGRSDRQGEGKSMFNLLIHAHANSTTCRRFGAAFLDTDGTSITSWPRNHSILITLPKRETQMTTTLL